MAHVLIASYGTLHNDPPPGTPHVVVDLTQALRNLHSDPAMRYLTGRDDAVRRQVLATPGAYAIIRDLVGRTRAASINCCPRNDRCTHTIQVHVFCQGGRHRSVAIADDAARILSAEGRRVQVVHRHITRPVLSRRYVEAPTYYEPTASDPPSVFMAGGITHCPDWQPTAANALLADGSVVFNPRRLRWPINDPEQTPAQIAWEYHHLSLADLTLFWFPLSDPKLTVQPITMYELGAAAATPTRHIVVGADPGYPRAADIHHQLAHARPGLVVHDTLDGTVAAAREQLAMLAGAGHRTTPRLSAADPTVA